MPSGSEFTLRAKKPAIRPTITPLNVEPTMMVAISRRDLGGREEGREAVEGPDDSSHDQSDERLVHVPLLLVDPDGS